MFLIEGVLLDIVKLYLHPGGCSSFPGEDRAGIRSAPHGGFDEYTGNILNDLASLYPGYPYVICDKLRGTPGQKKYDVNRFTPAHPRGGSFALQLYHSALVEAWRGETVPNVLYEIHGKGDWAHDKTEIAFIGHPSKCGWTAAHYERAKTIWSAHTGHEAYVYGVDRAAVYSHREYQSLQGLGGFFGVCGINVELSRSERQWWNPLNATSVSASHRIDVMEAINSLFTLGDETIFSYRI